MARKVTQQQADTVLRLVADWLGPYMGYGGPAPTGPAAADNADGPMLKMDWDWPGEPTPTILLEGGPYGWAVECCYEIQQLLNEKKLPVMVEPYAGYALCIYHD